MCKQYLLKISGLAVLTLLLLSPAFAQEDSPGYENRDTLGPRKFQNYNEIIIRQKNDKDAKITIEIKDGQVLVNGKPVSEFNDSSIAISKKKVRIIRDNGFSFSGPGEIEEPGDHMTLEGPGAADMAYAPPSPFRKHSGVTNLSLQTANRAFLGVTSEKPEKEGTGAEVKEISKGSAAEKAGLRQGDLITMIDETTILDPAGLSEAIHKYKPQDKVTITYKREGKEAKATAVLGKSAPIKMVYNYRYDVPNLNMPPMPDMPTYNYKQLMPQGDLRGFGREDARPRLGIRAQDTEDGKGVKVLEVGDESAAEKAGVKEGDIITSFDGKEVNSAVTLAELARAGKDKPSIKIGLIREGKSREVEVKVPKKLKTANL
jgi:serine protease Do